MDRIHDIKVPENAEILENLDTNKEEKNKGVGDENRDLFVTEKVQCIQ